MTDQECAELARLGTATVDASVRDVEDLVELGLPIWARYVRIRGADKATVGELDVPVTVGGTRSSATRRRASCGRR